MQTVPHPGWEVIKDDWLPLATSFTKESHPRLKHVNVALHVVLGYDAQALSNAEVFAERLNRLICPAGNDTYFKFTFVASHS